MCFVAGRWFVLSSGSDQTGCGLFPDKACGTLGFLAQELQRNLVGKTATCTESPNHVSGTDPLVEKHGTNTTAPDTEAEEDVTSQISIVTDVSLDIDQPIMVRNESSFLFLFFQFESPPPPARRC